MQRRLIWSSNEAHLILGRMYLKLRRDVSVTASGRTSCYVGTQFREHQKHLSIAIFMAIYGRLWQFFYEKKHKSIIIKSQTNKGCTMN